MTPYTTVYGDTTAYARAYEISTRAGKFVYTLAKDARMTAARKLSVYRHLLDANGQLDTPTPTDAKAFDTLPFVRVDNLQVRRMTTTCTATQEITTGIDYTHEMGCGTFPAGTVFHAIR